MSRSVNLVILVGNLGADPEIRSTASNTKVAQFSLATSRQWTAANGEKQERTEWHRCLAWDMPGKGKGLASIVEQYVRKGDKLYVKGRIEYRQFTDRDNQTRYVTEVNVQEILMLGSADKNREAAAKSATPAPPAKGAELPSEPTGGDDDDLPF